MISVAFNQTEAEELVKKRLDELELTTSRDYLIGEVLRVVKSPDLIEFKRLEYDEIDIEDAVRIIHQISTADRAYRGRPTKPISQ